MNTYIYYTCWAMVVVLLSSCIANASNRAAFRTSAEVVHPIALDEDFELPDAFVVEEMIDVSGADHEEQIENVTIYVFE